MFDLSWSELLVIAVVAIIVVGPKDLPRALRAVGRWSGKIKRVARDFQNQFNEAIREAELDSVRKEVESIGKIDPIAGLRKDVRDIEAGLKSSPARPQTASTIAAKPVDPELAEIADDKRLDEPSPLIEPEPPKVEAPAVKDQGETGKIATGGTP